MHSPGQGPDRVTGSDVLPYLDGVLDGRYRVENRIGEGGMADVYLASDLRHRRRVALKVLKPELAAAVGTERFLAEIETTAKLQHPHILPLFDSGEARGFLYYVMPFVDGETLRSRMDRERQLPVDEAVRIVTMVAEALDYAHGQGVIHRDIKPANIMLLRDGTPLVADFGIALAMRGGGRLTEAGLSMGTPHYMSPEQAAGHDDVDARSDVYAMACVLYEMLAGEAPFEGGTLAAILAKKLVGDPPSVRVLRLTVPEGVDAAITRGLSRSPADRPTSAGELAAMLSDVGTAAGSPRHAPETDDRLLSASEVADLLGTDVRYVYRNADSWTFARRLSPGTLRFSEKGLRAWVERGAR